MRNEFGGHPRSGRGHGPCVPRATRWCSSAQAATCRDEKLFPALYELERSGRLDVPVVGVGRTEIDDEGFRAHGRAALEDFAGPLDEAVVVRLLARLRFVRATTGIAAMFDRLAERLEGAGPAGRRIWRSRRGSSTMSPPASPSRAQPRRVASSSRNRSAATSRRPTSSTRSCTGTSTSPPSSASTTSSARSRSEPAGLPVRQLLPRTDLEPQLRAPACRSRWPSRSASRGAAGSTTSVGAMRDVVQNHLLQIVALLAMEPPVVGACRCAARREGEGLPGHALR